MFAAGICVTVATFSIRGLAKDSLAGFAESADAAQASLALLSGDADSAIDTLAPMEATLRSAATALRLSADVLSDIRESGTDFSRAIRSVARDLQTLSVTFRLMMSSQNTLGETARELGVSATTIETTLAEFPDLVAAVNDTSTQLTGVVVSLEALQADLTPRAGAFDLADRQLEDLAIFARSGRLETMLQYAGFTIAGLFFLMGGLLVVLALTARSVGWSTVGSHVSKS